jgi:hypothetical protein
MRNKGLLVRLILVSSTVTTFEPADGFSYDEIQGTRDHYNRYAYQFHKKRRHYLSYCTSAG